MASGGVRTRSVRCIFMRVLSAGLGNGFIPEMVGVVLRPATRGCCWRVYDAHSGLKGLPGFTLCAGNLFFSCQGKLIHCMWWFSVPCFRPVAKPCGGIKCVFWWVGGPASGVLIS